MRVAAAGAGDDLGVGWVAFTAGAAAGLGAELVPRAWDDEFAACAPLLAGEFALAELPPCAPAGELACPVAAGESHVDDSLTPLSGASA